MIASQFVPQVAPPAPAASVREALRAIPWLGEVSEVTLDWLARQAFLHQVPAGVRLFEQADTPAFAQVLISGVIELLAVRGEEERLIELVRPPDLILPAAIVSRQPYLVRARVRDDAQVLLIQADAFRTALTDDHAFCLAVLACQTAQFRRQMKQAKALHLRSAEERVGRYLLSLAESQPQATEVRLPLEKRLIASQLGMTRETLSRALPAMAAHGLRVVGDRLEIEDRAAARTAFPFDPLIDGPEPVTPLPVTRT